MSSHPKNIETIEKQLNNLLLSYISPENADRTAISEAEYRSMKMKLLQDKEQLEAALKKQSEEKANWLVLSEKSFNVARYSRKWFENGKPMTKREIFSSLGSNLLLKKQEISLELEFPFEVIKKKRKAVEREIALVRTDKKRITAMRIADFVKTFPLLCAGEDSNLQALTGATTSR